MADETSIDLTSVPDHAVRSVAANLVSDGALSLDQAAQTLAGRAIAPLHDSPAVRAQLEYDRLMRDPETNRKIWAGDKGLFDKVTILRMAKHNAEKLTSAPSAPADYNFVPQVEAALPKNSGLTSGELNGGFQQLCADFGIPPDRARAFVEATMETWNRDTQMTPEQSAENGNRRERDFLKAVRGDEATITAANAKIKEATGRDMDLLKVARSSGPDTALSLLWAAEDKLRTIKGGR
jgi:hypothetical protein